MLPFQGDKDNMQVWCTCVYICVCVFVHMCVHLCVHACACVCVCAYICTCVYIRLYKHVSMCVNIPGVCYWWYDTFQLQLYITMRYHKYQHVVTRKELLCGTAWLCMS